MTLRQSYYSSVLHFRRMSLPGTASALRHTGLPLHGRLTTQIKSGRKPLGQTLVWAVVLPCVMASTARSGSVAQRFGCSTLLQQRPSSLLFTTRIVSIT